MCKTNSNLVGIFNQILGFIYCDYLKIPLHAEHKDLAMLDTWYFAYSSYIFTQKGEKSDTKSPPCRKNILFGKTFYQVIQL